jgi:Na+/melibiose symporter-like transporter
MSYNVIFAVIGGAATFFFGWTWFAHVPGGSAVRDGYTGLAAAVALFAAIMIFASAQGTRDQIARLTKPAHAPRITAGQILHELRGCLKNPSYRALIIGMILLSATIGTRETLNAYSSLFFWGLPEARVRLLGLATPPAYLCAFVFAVRLHRRFDKRATMVGSTALTVVAAVVPIGLRLLDRFPRADSAALLPLLLLFVFLFYAGIATLMISMLSALADVVDEHELTTGRRQEGLFYASRTFFGKLTSALGHVLAGAAIDLIGFPTGAAPGTVPADVLFALGLIDGPLAALPSLVAIAFFARYRLDRRRHVAIQGQLAERRARAAPPRPQAAAEPPAAAEPAAG